MENGDKKTDQRLSRRSLRPYPLDFESGTISSRQYPTDCPGLFLIVGSSLPCGSEQLLKLPKLLQQESSLRVVGEVVSPPRPATGKDTLGHLIQRQESLFKLLRLPFEERKGYDSYDSEAPEWAQNLELSCSS